MKITDLREIRFSIILDSLIKGLKIPYKRDWVLWFDGNILYQIFYNKELEREIIHKSGIELQSFIDFCGNLSDFQLKKIYGNLKLLNLQKSLIDKSKDNKKSPIQFNPLDFENQK